MIAYYLVRHRDLWLRIGIQEGTEELHRIYLEQYYDDVEILGTLPLPIKDDIDKGSGIGTRRFRGCTIVTCKTAKVMMTIETKGTKTFLVQQREFIANTKRSQEEYLCRIESKNS